MPPPPPPDRRDCLYRDGRRYDDGGVCGDPVPPPAPTPSYSSSVPPEGYYRPATGAAYDRSYPDEVPLGYPPSSRSPSYWMEDEGGGSGGYKGFSRYGGGGGAGAGAGAGDQRDGRDMRGSYKRSPFRSYGNDFSRNQQDQPPPPPPRGSPLMSVASPTCYDSPGNRVDGDNLPRVTPWRRRESISEFAGGAGAGHVSSGQSTRPAASEMDVSAHNPAGTSPHGAEEDAPRKKARLGWGQGLAKYEKQKVHGPTDSVETVADGSLSGAGQKTVVPAPAVCAAPVAVPPPAPAVCASPVAVLPPAPAVCTSPVAVPLPAPSLRASPAAVPPPALVICASPVAVSSSPVSARCASPAAVPSSAPVPPQFTSSVAVPSSATPPHAFPLAVPSTAPAPEDKSCELTANTVLNSTQDAPGADHACNIEFPTQIDQLGDDPIDSFANLLAKFLQHDSCSGDSKDSTSTSKLLLLKESFSKEIEKTELEIDSLEGELKSVHTEARTTLEDSPTGVTYTENVSLSTGTSEVPGNAEICDKSHLKEPRELSLCSKIPVVQDASAKDAEMIETETAPVQNTKIASSEESAACPGVAEGQACAAADVELLKSSRQAEPQMDVDNERLEASSCHTYNDAVKPDGSVDLPGRQCLYSDHEYNLLSSLTSSNNDIAKVANEMVFKHLLDNMPKLDLLASSHVSIHRNNNSVINERLVLHKRSLRFKEQALTFKFRALRYLWKEDVRLLCARKQGSKSNKRIDQSIQTSHIRSQRQRSTNRSRLAMPAGNSSTFPTTEISAVANKLFLEFQINHYRYYLKMPALIIDEKEKECSGFVSKNGLVEDPVAVEKERVLINPWTREEKETFMEMLAKFGKDFSKISSYLTHKTTADCVEFYYKHHKSDSFREVKKLLDQRQQPTSNYLGAKTGKQWNCKANTASLDILGVASEVAAQGFEYEKRLEKISTKSLIRNGSNVSFVAKKSYRRCFDNVSLHERESVAADVLAGICGTLSPEGMSLCIASSADPGQKISITTMDHVFTPGIDESVDEKVTLSDQECEIDPVDWNDDEKSIFIEAMNNYGKDFAQISSCVKSRSYEQCRVFFCKARKSLCLHLINQGVADVSMPTSDNNGGRSDTDEACAAEMDSAICSTQSFAKTWMNVCPTGRAIQDPSSCIISKQMEGDVLDVKTEEGENKADQTCSLDDHNRFAEVTPQSTCGPIDMNCPETTSKLESTDDTDDQTNKHDSSAISSSDEQAASVHSEARMDGCSHHALDNALVKPGNSCPSASIAANSVIKENVLHFSKMTGAPISAASTSSYQHSMPGDKPPSKPKPQVTPLTPKDLMPVQFSSVLPDPTSFCFEGIASITTPIFQDRGNRACNALEAKGMNMYPAFKDQSHTGNQHDTLFRSIDGYTKQHLATELPFFTERNSRGTVSTSHSDRFTITKFQNGRCSSLGLPNTTDGIHLDRKHNEVSDGSLRPCSRYTSSEGNEQTKRPGDVKLFGQILSHQSSLQNSGSSCNGIKNNPRDRVSCSSKPAVTPNLGLVERSVRSYGRPAFVSCSSHVMAKCQTSLVGVPFYSAKNGTLGVFSDYQQPLVQAHQSDPKRLERYSDPQKRNGMEFKSGFQQPVKVSRFGDAGILAGNVSDPVAALKAQYGPGSKIRSCDVDTWKDIESR